jgi:hypothetical protein
MSNSNKLIFEKKLRNSVESLNEYVVSDDRQWTIKGFIDIFKNVYTISSDTKIISKILEIHIFPKILQFAQKEGYHIVLAQHQNYYPDISFVKNSDHKVKFAVDIKTTYRLENPEYCNGFTLGSHGEYFTNRLSKKNIQFPYSEYMGHFCLGIIYTRGENNSINETKTHSINELKSITSVIKDIKFFLIEKWKLASDKSGSGNTANIGSINCIDDILKGNGVFSKLGEKWFDDYWMNYGRIIVSDPKTGATKKLTRLEDFIHYRKGNIKLIVKKNAKTKKVRE